MWQFLPAAISAGSQLLGGLLGQKTQQQQLQFQQQQFQQQQANWNQQFEYQLGRDKISDEFAREQFGFSKEQIARSEALQREFAQSGIQWRVEDARKAGLHPLAALGAGGAAYSTPSFSVGSVASGRAPSSAVGGFAGPSGNPMGTALAGMGQDISRAMLASATASTRDAAFHESVRQLQLTNYTLRNDLLASQIQRLRQGTGPSGPPVGTATSVPTKPDLEKRNRLVMDNEEVIGHPGWSPTQAVSDEYGDENPAVSWVYGPLKMYMDWRYHTMTPSERMIETMPRRGTGRVGGPSGGGW